MKGRIISDWSKADFQTDRGRALIRGALQAFVSAPEKVAKLQGMMNARLQAFGNAGDFPTRINEIIEKFHLSTLYDAGWEQIFDVKDFTGTSESGFDILDVEDGLTFRKVPIDGKAHIYKMAGAKISVDFDIYGAGLGWHRTLIDDKKYWTLEDNAFAFRNKYYADMAAVFYALIDAVSGTYNLAWQNPEPSTLANTNELYTANRDAQTLNAAAQAIITSVKDKGYGLTLDNAQFVVLAPFQLMGRLNRALSLMLQSVSGSATQAAFKFRPIITTGLSASTSYYVCLPKLKTKAGKRMDLTIFTRFDEESYSDVAVGWGRYAGAIGDSTQFRRCATS